MAKVQLIELTTTTLNALEAFFSSKPSSLRGLIDLFSALLAPAIGVVATYIAYQQYRLEKRATKRELLDRRLAIFKACMSFLAQSVQQSPNLATTGQFLRETADSFYLFKDEVTQYLEEIYQKAIKFECYSKMLSGPSLPFGDRKTKLAEENSELQGWFAQQLSAAREKFKPYLDVHE